MKLCLSTCPRLPIRCVDGSDRRRATLAAERRALAIDTARRIRGWLAATVGRRPAFAWRG